MAADDRRKMSILRLLFLTLEAQPTACRLLALAMVCAQTHTSAYNVSLLARCPSPPPSSSLPFPSSTRLMEGSTPLLFPPPLSSAFLLPCTLLTQDRRRSRLRRLTIRTGDISLSLSFSFPRGPWTQVFHLQLPDDYWPLQHPRGTELIFAAKQCGALSSRPILVPLWPHQQLCH